ncbi:monocarboxylate transporter 12-like [Amblyomma americanum]
MSSGDEQKWRTGNGSCETAGRSGRQDKPIPLDTCWIVPVAMAGASFLITMPWSWFGLLFVLFLEKFGITREEASWPKSIGIMLSHLSGLAVYVLQRQIKTYYIVLLSTILTSAAFIFSALAPDIFWMTVTFGVMHGLGHGIFLTSSAVYTLLHFDRYRSVATSSIFIAYGISAVVSQFVLAQLVDTYALDGALLVYGGILMNSTAVVLLARNPTPTRLWWQRSTQDSLLNGCPKPTCYNALTDSKRKPGATESCQPTERPRQLESASLKHVLELFSAPAFYVLVVAVVVGDYTAGEYSTTIVDYGIDKGIPLESAKHLVTFASMGQLAGRVVVPVLADCLPFSRRPLYVLSFLCIFACMVAMPHVFSFGAIFVLAAVTGVSQGYILCIRYVLIAEFLGVQRTAVSSGIVGVVMVPVSLVSPSIIGQFRDATGSYDGYYRMLGAMCLGAAVLFGVYDLYSRQKAKRTRNGKEQNLEDNSV